MAPDRQDAVQSPHPLHKADSISALPVFSLNLGAEYGQIDTQTPQLLHAAASTWATVPLTAICSAARNVTALAAAAWA
jgi:hypothetical protein